MEGKRKKIMLLIKENMKNMPFLPRLACLLIPSGMIRRKKGMEEEKNGKIEDRRNKERAKTRLPPYPLRYNDKKGRKWRRRMNRKKKRDGRK